MPQSQAKPGSSNAVDVAVAVLQRPDGSVLLAMRPKDKVYAGYWEFPGGKVEPGETALEALHREIREELCVDIVQAYPWINRVFVYPHATVNLHFFRVMRWQGEPHALEHQSLAWQKPGSVEVAPMLPANGPVLLGLSLPFEYAISQAGEAGPDRFLARLAQRLDQGLRLIQLREPGLQGHRLQQLGAQVVALAHRAGAQVLVNSDLQLARHLGADGVHLTARQLPALARRPDLKLVGASCHSAQELRAAEQLGVDFAVMGPVRPTPTHPGSPPMGWEGFEAAVRGTAIPVYALGGVAPEDLELAWSRGAHGIAMIRGAWKSKT